MSGDLAKLPLHVYRRKPGGGKTEDPKHPAFRLLHYEACPEVSALQFKRIMAFHALTEGNGYAYIKRNGAGLPVELWPLSPMKTYPVREDRRLWYVTEVGSVTRRIPAEDVFHLMGLSFDGLVGYAAVSKMRETLGLALAAENFGSIFFRNNARPNVVLKHPGRLKPEAKSNLRESWERMHSGLENAHRTAVLEEGMDVVALMHNARDSQLLELKGFSRVQVCNFFGVPAHKVGAGNNASYNSLEQENESYVEDGGGLGYWLPAFAVEAWRKLLTEQQKQDLTHTVAFQRRHMLRANLSTRTSYYTQMIQNGVLSPNEVREEEGYNPRDGGDDYVTPTSPHTAANAQGPPPEKGKDGKDADQQQGQDQGKGPADAAKAGQDDDAPAAGKNVPKPRRSLPGDAEQRGSTDPKRTPADALQVLAGMPETAAGRVSVLMPTADPDALAGVKPADLQNLPVRRVRLARLTATRPDLSRARLETILGDPSTAGTRWNIGEAAPNDRPYVVRQGGKRLVYDGHHRLTADMLLGKEKADVYLLDRDRDAGRSASAGAERRFDEDQPRDDDGKFASGGGDKAAGRKAEDKDRKAKRDAEDEQVEKQRDREDAETGRRRGKEDDEVSDRRDAEDKATEKARDKEDAATEKVRDKEDKATGKKRDREDAATEKVREKEDDKFSEALGKEYDDQGDRHEKEADALETKHGKEDDALEAAQQKEWDEKEAAGASEDEMKAQGDKVRAEVEEQAKRHADEAREMGDRHKAEEKALNDDQTRRAGERDAEIGPKRDAEDAETQKRRDEEEDAVGAKREAEDKDIGGRRDAEDKMRQDARDAEDKALETKRDAEDEQLTDARSAEDDARQDARDAEDDEVERKRDEEDEADEKAEAEAEGGERSATPFRRYSDDQPRQPDGKFGSGGAARKATGLAKKTLAAFGDAYDKVTSLPVLKQLRQGGDYVKGLTKTMYAGLERRYGRPAALAIMAAGQAIGWGSMAAGVALHVPLYLPGSSLWGSLPAVAVAETFLQARRGLRKIKDKLVALKSRRGDGEMSEADVKRIAEEQMKEIADKFLAWVGEHKQEITDAAKDADQQEGE